MRLCIVFNKLLFTHPLVSALSVNVSRIETRRLNWMCFPRVFVWGMMGHSWSVISHHPLRDRWWSAEPGESSGPGCSPARRPKPLKSEKMPGPPRRAEPSVSLDSGVRQEAVSRWSAGSGEGRALPGMCGLWTPGDARSEPHPPDSREMAGRAGTQPRPPWHTQAHLTLRSHTLLNITNTMMHTLTSPVTSIMQVNHSHLVTRLRSVRLWGTENNERTSEWLDILISARAGLVLPPLHYWPARQPWSAHHSDLQLVSRIAQETQAVEDEEEVVMLENSMEEGLTAPCPTPRCKQRTISCSTEER